MSDVLQASGKGQCTVLLALDISAAFDAVEHSTLLERARTVFGVTGGALKHIRPLLTLEAAKTFAVSIVGSKLDYCNCVLFGISQSNLDKLQRVQNVLAQVTVEAPWSVSPTELRRDLHWLPINQRVTYKLSVLTYKALHTGQPCYLADLIELYRPSRVCLLYTSPTPRD